MVVMMMRLDRGKILSCLNIAIPIWTAHQNVDIWEWEHIKKCACGYAKVQTSRNCKYGFNFSVDYTVKKYLRFIAPQLPQNMAVNFTEKKKLQGKYCKQNYT